MRPEIRDLLACVSKPYRYCGGEVGSVRKDWDAARARVCLAFPDAYEIGMSHLGLAILYRIINDERDMLAERAFAPWLDMEARLRERGIPLFSLESQRPLADFDIVGFSLAYELTYANMLTMLDLAGIPRRAADRGDGDPIVIAGGPCAFNPMPVAAFFDAIVIGDGEGTALEIARAVGRARREGRGRAELIEGLAGMAGVYVPSGPISEPGMARVADLNRAPYPSAPIVAHAATQERAAVEAARGCTRGCRFCQAGYTYRPLRQRSGAAAARLACDAIGAGGRDDFSFLALSIGDWPALEGALEGVQRDSPVAVSASLPSLRAESLTDAVVGAMGRARAGSFTLAPEAATERMRRFINKGNSDSDLYASVERVFAGGFGQVKLYFMLGLPGETDDEVEGIARVADRCLDIGRRHHRRPSVTVSTSTFVPKAHTPFQWDAQIGIERTLELQGRLKRRLRRPGVYYRWHDAGMSFLEGVLSRGGGELAPAIEAAYRAGARFDGWDECFDLALWRSAFEEAGVDPDAYLDERGFDFEFPWDGIGAGPSKDFLLRERRRAAEYELTPDCATGPCSGCGICRPEEGLVNRIASVAKGEGQGTPVKPSPRIADHVFRYRIHYSKADRAAFLGHLEVLDALRRAFRSAGLPLRYSEGFRPRARIDGGPALPVGMESVAEFVDVELASEIEAGELASRLSGRLPDGMRVTAASAVEAGSPSISESIRGATYEVGPEGLGGRASAARDLLASDKPIRFERVRKGKGACVDVRGYVDGLAVEKGGVLRLTILALRPALRISEVLQVLLGISDEDARLLPVRKVAVDWKGECLTS